MARTKKKKLEIVFDPQKRKEFLTGFRKRKNERRSRAKADLERNLKEERVRIRHEVKEGFKEHLKKSFEPLRELTDEDKVEGTKKETYEDEEVQVKIVELSTNDLAAQSNMLGANIAEESEEEEETQSNSGDERNQTNVIPGMDFDVNKSRKRKADKEDEETNAKATKGSDIKSKKDLDKLMKTRTLNKIKKSKLFKQKERIDKKVNQKKAKRDRNKTINSVPKHQRKKLKHGKPTGGQTRYNKGRMMNRKELRKRAGGGD